MYAGAGVSVFPTQFYREPKTALNNEAKCTKNNNNSADGRK